MDKNKENSEDSLNEKVNSTKLFKDFKKVLGKIF